MVASIRPRCGSGFARLVGDDERPAALVSERDCIRAMAAGKDPACVRAVDVASTKLVWCDAGATVDEVAVRMMDRYIRHILVERDGALVGIVSAPRPARGLRRRG